MKTLVLALFVFTMLFACTTVPSVNEQASTPAEAGGLGVSVIQYQHSVYIPIRRKNADVGVDLDGLFKEIDKWLEGNSSKRVVSVAIVNALVIDKGSETAHTVPSGALIVFEGK